MRRDRAGVSLQTRVLGGRGLTDVNVNVSIYIAHYRTVPLMCSVCRILLKQLRLQ